MKKFSLPYGKSHLDFIIDSKLYAESILPNPTKPLEDPGLAITQAVINPLGNVRLNDFLSASSVGIAINDKTRPVPHTNPVVSLLSHIESLGFEQTSIKLFIGSGTHKPMAKDEFENILPKSIIENYKIIPHNCDDSPMADLGKTMFNTPIKINRDFYSCDLKIVVGNIEPHHFMGFSGGVKTAAIGLAGRETITANHAMLIHDMAQSGIYHRNPLRQEIEEIGQKIKIDFCLGSVLDEDKQILQIYFGPPNLVMLEAIPFIKNIFGAEVSAPFDLVIASPGGYPKDINFYQAEKGLTHAARITRDGGCVIILAECAEGSGSVTYEEYVSKAGSNREIINQFNSGFFEIGPHKAFQIAREAERIHIVLVSEIPPERVKQWKLTPGTPHKLDQLIRSFTSTLPPNARIAILPAASRTMTEIKNE
ncbi:MAG: nickel-dependent lactate racemase [Brevefilum sp.]|nr:nickel-dependent lactate racemase [Brevefilum sp.]MDT8382588.1 nickel-dependent lactate racemase [Brevefilum sp.]MDW7754763.1 nickel-dependent lactate racemase [Brevefilum sp.]